MEDLERLYHQLDRIEDTLDRITPRLSAIETDLAYHIKRSDMLEADQAMIQIQADKTDKKLAKFEGFFSITGWLIALAVSIVTLLSVLGKV